MMKNRSPDWIVFVASAGAFVMLAQLLAGKTIRDALFLSIFGANALPYAIVAAGIVSFASAIPASRVLARFGPARTMPWLFTLSAGLFLAEWLLIESARRGVTGFLYLHLAASSALLISGFWATLSERFDPHAARRSLARVASFATLGGVLGGLISERVSALFGLNATLLVLALMNGLCAILVAGIGESETNGEAGAAAEIADERPGVLLKRTPYLQLMAVASLLLAMIDSLLDFAIRASADTTFGSGEELIGFFGIYYTVVGLVSFLVQSVLTERVLGRFGIGPSMASLPVAVGLTGMAALLVPGLASVVAMRGAGSVLTSSVFRTGFELLYTPLPLFVKRPTKTLVDVGGQRIGDVLAGGLILAVIAAWPLTPLPGVIVLAIGIGAALVFVLLRLQGEYRRQLALNLKLGEISLDDLEGLARSVAETHVQLDRAEILARIHEAGFTHARTEGADAPRDDVRSQIAALGDARHARAAAALLRARGSSVVSDLLGALAAPDQPDFVKLLLPGLLEPIREPRVVEALLATMRGESFETRVRCARTAARMVALVPELAPGRERTLAALRAEVANQTLAPSATAAPAGVDRPDSVLIADHPQLRVGRRVEHVLTLLALDFGPELMRSVLLGLHSDHPAGRGTALEYLEVSLPEDLRRSLQPIFGVDVKGSGSRRARAARQLEAELLRIAQGSIVSDGSKPSDR